MSVSGPEVIVIGAGHNGLTAAAMLARRGRRVLVLERRDVAGGLAVGDEMRDGGRAGGMLHDASLVSKAVVQTLDLERQGLATTDTPPPVFVPQLKGRGLLLHHDPHEAFDEIRHHSDNDARRYRDLRGFFDRLAPVLGELLDAPPPDLLGNGLSGLLELARRGLALRRLGEHDMHQVLRVVPMCVADFTEDWFETELLRAAMAAPALEATFTGPRSPGTNANLVRHAMLASSSVTVTGGPAALIDALVQAATSAGVEIRTGADVEAIRVERGGVTGVTLAGGETIAAGTVAASCDPRHTFTQLLGPADISRRLEHHIECLRARGTTAKVDLVLDGPLKFACRPNQEITRARIGETLDELEQAFDAVKYRRFSAKPALDVRVVVATDGATDGATDDERTVISIIAHFAPYDLDGGWNDGQRERLGDAVLDRLGAYVPDLRERVVASQTLAPPDLERRFGVTHGHVHHGEHAIDQLVVRPAPGCARYATPIDGLFLCGSGSHPGGGLTCRPGAIAAAVMMA